MVIYILYKPITLNASIYWKAANDYTKKNTNKRLNIIGDGLLKLKV